MSRKKEVIEKEGAFAYAKEGHGEEEMVFIFNDLIIMYSFIFSYPPPHLFTKKNIDNIFCNLYIYIYYIGRPQS